MTFTYPPLLLRSTYLLCLLAIIVVGLLTAQQTAMGFTGYVDPGAGLLILQSLGSVVVGFLFVMRRKLARLLHLGKPEVAADSSVSEDAASRHDQ